MGLGISQYVPIVVYSVALVVILLSIFKSPVIGVYFLFPLLPYQNIFEKIKHIPLGKDLNDLIIMAVLIGWLLKEKSQSVKNIDKSVFTEGKPIVQKPIIFLSILTFLGFIIGSLNEGAAFDLHNTYLVDWKNYMLLPLIWFLTFKNLKDKKQIMVLTILLILGLLGAANYFRGNLQWMNTWHFSHKARNMMTGLFVYLGANHYGAFFAHFVFIPMSLILFTKSLTKKIILAFVMSLVVYCIIYTYSRGAYIALLAGILFIGFVKDKRILPLLLLFFIFWRSLVPISVVERIDMTQNEEGELENSAAIRVALWNAAIDMFQKSPLIGTGFNTFRYVYQDSVWLDTHNYYLKMLAELGILGLLVLLYLLYSAFMEGWTLYTSTSDWFYKAMGLGFCACVLSVAITNAFGNRWSYLSLGSYFWVFMGITSKIRHLVKSEAGKEKALIQKKTSALMPAGTGG